MTFGIEFAFSRSPGPIFSEDLDQRPVYKICPLHRLLKEHVLILCIILTSILIAFSFLDKNFQKININYFCDK